MTQKENYQSPFTKRLKEARKETGLSQKQLGINAGFDEFSSSARMNQYERGKHTPDYLAIKQISTALNLPTAYLFTEEDDLAELIKKYSRLSAKEKKALLKSLD
ncbi:MAG: XRE family transcriptional regulator [Gammaproteobacteria bacterium]|nr:MAG: XRE family transcriptional regulator [Gammaproteobacteria bacterium]